MHNLCMAPVTLVKPPKPRGKKTKVRGEFDIWLKKRMGDSVRQLREERGLEPEEVAAFLNFKPDSYKSYERGDRAFSLGDAARLAKRWGLPLDRVVFGPEGSKAIFLLPVATLEKGRIR